MQSPSSNIQVVPPPPHSASHIHYPGTSTIHPYSSTIHIQVVPLPRHSVSHIHYPGTSAIHCQCSSTINVHPLSMFIHYPCSSTIHQCSSTIHVHPLFIHVRPLSIHIHPMSIFRWYPRPHTQRHTSTTLELSMPLRHLWAQMSLLCGGEIQFKMPAYNFLGIKLW